MRIWCFNLIYFQIECFGVLDCWSRHWKTSSWTLIGRLIDNEKCVTSFGFYSRTSGEIQQPWWPNMSYTNISHDMKLVVEGEKCNILEYMCMQKWVWPIWIHIVYACCTNESRTKIIWWKVGAKQVYRGAEVYITNNDEIRSSVLKCATVNLLYCKHIQIRQKYLVVPPVKPGPWDIERLLRTIGPVAPQILAVDKYYTFAPALWTQSLVINADG